jgi:hypothetical protein
MAKRYSGDLQISVTYDDRNFYRTSVSRGGKLLWHGTVNPAPVGFGPGVAYDSPQAYDEVASSALAFADDEVGGIGDTADFDENLTGYLIQRKPPTRTTATASHATRKSRTSSTASHATRKLRVTTTASRPPRKLNPSIRAGDCVTMREPHRKYLTSSTGGSVFKVISTAGNALTLEGPLDWHPKHRKQKVMGARQFKRVACPRYGDARDGDGAEHAMPVGQASHATRSRIVVRKIEGRWQPVNASGVVVRGKIYNADGAGYSTKQGAEEAAGMIRELGRTA